MHATALFEVYNVLRSCTGIAWKATAKLEASVMQYVIQINTAYPSLAIAMKSGDKSLEVCLGIPIAQHKIFPVLPSLNVYNHSFQWNLCQGVIVHHLDHILKGEVA